ncbi:hypothetical protein ACEPPN_019378 [Leptodophora sp. 'Broadleaf-Isolate-01']
MAVPRGNTTPSSREAGGELLPQSLTSSKLIPSGFHRAASSPSVIAPSFQSAFNAEADSPHQLGHLGCFHTAPSITTPSSALSSSIFTPQDSPTLSTLSSSTFNDTTLPISLPPSVSSISDFFRTQVPNHQRRQDNPVRGTQGWVSQAASQDLPEIVVRNICIAHYIQLREQSKDLTLSSGKGRRTAAFKATAKELLLQLNEVRKGWQKGVNYLLLARLGGPGSLLLIGKRARTLEHMPELDIQARKLNDSAIGIISRYIAAQGWKSLSLMARLSSELLEKGETNLWLTSVPTREHTAELSSGHRKRRQSTQIDRPSKHSAHGPSEELGLKQLLEAARYEECQNTFVDLFPQQVGGPEITTFMKTTGENGHLNTWMHLTPWSVKQPEITAYMTTFNEGGQSNSWVQDLVPWPDNEPDITTYMATFNEDGQTNTQMQGLFLQPLEGPDLATSMKPFEQGCLPLQTCADSSVDADI